MSILSLILVVFSVCMLVVGFVYTLSKVGEIKKTQISMSEQFIKSEIWVFIFFFIWSGVATLLPYRLEIGWWALIYAPIVLSVFAIFLLKQEAISYRAMCEEIADR